MTYPFGRFKERANKGASLEGGMASQTLEETVQATSQQ